MHALLEEKIKIHLNNFYQKGIDLKGVPLKNYTSGDGNNRGFEKTVTDLLYISFEHFNIDTSRYKIDGEYFKPDKSSNFDEQRMDQHIWIDGKVPLIIESRAWMDKPFYTLKRAVVRNFMMLPYVREKLTENVQFFFVGLNIDISDRLILTLDKTMGFGDRISTVHFSQGKRNAKSNYFDRGVSEVEITKFIGLISPILEAYSHNCLCNSDL